MSLERIDRPARRGRPRDQAVRGQILNAALALTEEVGFQIATMDDVARRAGTSKATIYRWWATKSSLVMTAFFEEYAGSLRTSDQVSTRESVRRLLKSIVKSFAGRRGQAFRAIVAEAQGSPEGMEELLDRWFRPRQELMRRVLMHGIETHELPRNLDVSFTIDALYGPIYLRLLAPYAAITDRFIDQVCESALPPSRARS